MRLTGENGLIGSTCFPREAMNWYREKYFEDSLSTLTDLQRQARLDDRGTACFLGVSLRTVQRWRQRGRVPEWARLLLAMCGGHVPWPNWDGWHLGPDGLHAPGYLRGPIDPHEVMAMHFTRQEVAELRRQVRVFYGMADQATIPQAQEVETARRLAFSTKPDGNPLPPCKPSGLEKRQKRDGHAGVLHPRSQLGRGRPRKPARPRK